MEYRKKNERYHRNITRIEDNSPEMDSHYNFSHNFEMDSLDVKLFDTIGSQNNMDNTEQPRNHPNNLHNQNSNRNTHIFLLLEYDMKFESTICEEINRKK
jgi:hypothetical protein